MKYCLDKIQTNDFIDFLIKKKELKDCHTLSNFLEEYNSWELEIVFFSYLWAQTIRKNSKKVTIDDHFIKHIYDKREDHNFKIEEFSLEYVEFIVAHLSDRSKNLEENLILLNNKFSDYDWRAQIRS